MEIEYLCEFTVIAKLESFSRAAEELCISQSSLSKHMLALERELDAPLLVRNSRSVALSPAGAEILPLAAEALSLRQKILVAAAKQSSRDRTLLTIASIPVMAQYNITGFLARFQRAHPEVTLEVRECEQRELGRMLGDGSCELAFSRSSMDGDSLEYLEFCRDSLVAALPKNHPLAGKPEVTLRELAHEPLLFLDERTGLYALCQELCRAAGFTPNVVYTGHRPENIVDLSAQGMGVALLMRRHTDYVKNPAVTCAAISPAVESAICLVRRTDRRPSRLGGAFWEMLREESEKAPISSGGKTWN